MMSIKPGSIQAFSIWRDESEPGVTHSSEIMRSNNRTSSLKRPLALRSSNLPLRSSPILSKSMAPISHDTSSRKPIADNLGMTQTPPKADTVHPLLESPLDCLPIRIRKMFIERSFFPPASMTTREELIAAADALDMRSKLMQTEVPLSLFPRAIRGQRYETPQVKPFASEERSPQLVSHAAESSRSRGEPDKLDPGALYPGLSSHDTHSPAYNFFRSDPLCPPPTRSVTPMLSLYATVKVSNIPWDISTEQIMEFLGKNTRLALYTSICAPIHFVLDRTSGKTQSDIYLEISTIGDAERLAQRRSGKTLGSRTVNIELVSSKEMLNATFPRARDGHWLIREEVQNLLTHAKTFKSPYTRKCPQRPFENYISVLALFPWANRSVYVQSQVELLYMGYASIVSILQWHIRKGKLSGLDASLLQRLVTAGTNLTDFSPEQKKAVCSSVGFFPEATLLPFPSSATSIPAQSSVSHAPSLILESQIDTVARPVVPEIHVLECASEDSIESICQHRVMEPRSLQSQQQGSVLCAADLAQSLLKLQALDECPDKVQSRPPFEAIHSGGISKAEKSGVKNGSETKLSPREQWLLNARRAGIAVGVPTGVLIHPR